MCYTYIYVCMYYIWKTIDKESINREAKKNSSKRVKFQLLWQSSWYLDPTWSTCGPFLFELPSGIGRSLKGVSSSWWGWEAFPELYHPWLWRFLSSLWLRLMLMHFVSSKYIYNHDGKVYPVSQRTCPHFQHVKFGSLFLWEAAVHGPWADTENLDTSAQAWNTCCNEDLEVWMLQVWPHFLLGENGIF